MMHQHHVTTHKEPRNIKGLEVRNLSELYAIPRRLSASPGLPPPRSLWVAGFPLFGRARDVDEILNVTRSQSLAGRVGFFLPRLATHTPAPAAGQFRRPQALQPTARVLRPKLVLRLATLSMPACARLCLYRPPRSFSPGPCPPRYCAQRGKVG